MNEKTLEEEVTATLESTAKITPQTKEKTVKTCGEKIFAKIFEMESNFVILRNELQNLSPEELAKFQSLKKANAAGKDNLSAQQKRLIKIVKEGDEKFVRAVGNVVNSMIAMSCATEQRNNV